MGEVAKDGTDCGVAVALLLVNCENHGTAAEPDCHMFLEGYLMADFVRNFKNDFINEIGNNHFKEVVFFESFRKDHLIGDVVVFETLLLDHFILAEEQVLHGTRVEHDDHDLCIIDFPVEQFYVRYFIYVRLS